MLISVFVVIFNALICFCFFRSTASYIIQYLMNKNAIKKRKKGQTFKDWLLFKKFRIEIPKYHIILYYICSLVYAILLCIMIIFHIVNADADKITIRKILVFIVLGNVIFIGLYDVIVFGFHTGYTFIHRKDKVNIRGVYKKEYRAKISELRQQEKKNSKNKEKDYSENSEDF